MTTISLIVAVIALSFFLILCGIWRKREPTRKTKEVRQFADYKHFDEDQFLRNRSERGEW